MNSATSRLCKGAVVALVAAAVVFVAASQRAERVSAVLAVPLTAGAAETCRNRADQEVPLGATQCIMHDVYVCTPNQVWKKTDKHC